MKRKDLLRIYLGLEFILNRYSGLSKVNLAMTLSKNKRLIQGEAEDLQQAGKESKEFLDYRGKLSQLASEFADRDKDDKAIIVNNNYQITKRLGEYNVALLELDTANKDLLDKRKEQIENLKKLEDEEVEEPKFIKVPASELPDELGFMVDKIYELICEE